MKQEKKPNWIVLKIDEMPNVMWCQRCGRKIPFHTPCSLEEAIGFSKAYIKIHKKCKEKLL